jgi:hypothetical protein
MMLFFCVLQWYRYRYFWQRRGKSWRKRRNNNNNNTIATQHIGSSSAIPSPLSSLHADMDINQKEGVKKRRRSVSVETSTEDEPAQGDPATVTPPEKSNKELTDLILTLEKDTNAQLLTLKTLEKDTNAQLLRLKTLAKDTNAQLLTLKKDTEKTTADLQSTTADLQSQIDTLNKDTEETT